MLASPCEGVDLEAVSATDEEATIPADVAYVTACALGLAFSEHRGSEAIAELTSAAGGRWETLEAARDALSRYPAEDAAVVRAASELLTSAVATARSARS